MATQDDRHIERVFQAVGARLTPELEGSARGHIEQIVAQWLDPAGSPVDADDVIEVGIEDLNLSLGDTRGNDCLVALAAFVTEGEIDRASGKAYRLATEVADGTVDRATAAPEADALQLIIDDLGRSTEAAADPEQRRRWSRRLADANLELRYALDPREGAISLRLNRHIEGPG